MKKKISKIIALFLAINIFIDAIYPTAALALTSGPTQPEMHGFTPVGTSEMVNTFSGDFNYNIPLMDVGGYPINLSYQSGVTMDQEASWVGLGWSLNPGVIERNMRSLPDDFKGDEIKKEFNVKPNLTFGGSCGLGLEFTGLRIPSSLDLSTGLSYNNYSGYNFSGGVDVGLSTSASNRGKNTATLGLGISASTDGGVDISDSLSYSNKINGWKDHDRMSTKVGLNYNTREGLKDLSLETSTSKTERYKECVNNKEVDREKTIGRVQGPSGEFLSFSTPTFVPSSGHNMINTNLSFTATLGSELYPVHWHGSFGGFFAGQFLKEKENSYKAYGYINSEFAKGDEDLMDFNREKDEGFNEFTPAMPITNFTYDVYNVSGQGIGGAYRAHRGDIGIVDDVTVRSFSGGIKLPGIELGAGNTAHSGLNIAANQSNSKSGKWENDNAAREVLGFRSKTEQSDFEPVYFKKVGELTAETDPDFFKDMGGFEPVKININRKPQSSPAQQSYDKEGTNMFTTSRVYRARRNEVISFLTAKEAHEYAEIKQIETYSGFTPKSREAYALNQTLYTPSSDSYSRTTSYHQDHHTSQITTYRTDGARYVYGIPAYNVTQDERTFSIEPDENLKSYDQMIETGTALYTPGTEDSKHNKRGFNHYYEKVVTPAYAHSYLLTEVLSADYVDVSGNGPTDDDLGTYTKINYTNINENYKWRVPFKANTVSYNEGFKSQKGKPYIEQGELNGQGDDKGSFVYGEKEMWYMHSIETKNYVAEFELGDRNDGYGVADEAGGLSTASASKKLVAIRLYSKQDKLQNGSDAVPIETVHFIYDYLLCRGVENSIINGGGKLTLTGFYYTYGNSEKGKLSPYEFTYNPTQANYNLKGYDRWGSYKLNTKDNPTAEFPYTTQNYYVDPAHPETGIPDADKDASVWLLQSIKLPSGGTINVEYEADDYAYVQNRQAMQMFKVIACTKGIPNSDGSDLDKIDLYDNDNVDPSRKSHNYLTIELPDYPTSIVNYNDIMKSLIYNKDGSLIEDMYFKFLIKLGKMSQNYDKEFVPGYASIDDNTNDDGTLPYGHFEHDGKHYGYFKLKTVQILDKIKRPSKEVNPISQAGWLFTRMHLPDILTDKRANTDKQLVQFVKSMLVVLKSTITFLNGFYNQMRMDRMSSQFIANKSMVRLNNPTGFKKGGGVRVRKLLLSDNWNTMTSDPNDKATSTYGQIYSYTTTENGHTISSGVASYEPLIGGDENPFRLPKKSANPHIAAADDPFYIEEPFGECFFPGASVGYSKVTVKNFIPDGVSVTRHATGYVVNEFYTSKDFPTIPDRTDLDPKRVKPNPVLKFLKIGVRDFLTATQGFVVRLNNMNGQLAAKYVCNEKGGIISGTKYIYRTTEKNVEVPKYVNSPIKIGTLDNTMLVMERDGKVSNKMVGVDYDFVADMREEETVSRTAALHGNLEAFLVAAFPGIVPSIIPSYGQERLRFRLGVTTKVIHQFGLLDEVIVYNEKSIISTKNKILDAETGEVLLTETKNQFNDPVYSFSYPAHFVYDRMGPAYKNLGLNFQLDQVSNPSQYFVPGDELGILKLETAKASSTVTVYSINPLTYKGKIDKNALYIRVKRTGAILNIFQLDGSNGYIIKDDELEVLDLATADWGAKAWVKEVSPSLKIVDRNGYSIPIAGLYARIMRSGRRNQSAISIGSIVSKRAPLKNANVDELSNEFLANSGTNVLTASAVEYKDDWGLFCQCDVQKGQPYNPYTKGALGNWRLFKTYAQLTGRTQSVKNQNTNIREDGVYTSFYPFWVPPTAGSNAWGKKDEFWQKISEVTIYSPYGVELDNEDALGIHSSALYGYNNTLPLAVAANAKYKQIAFDSFEDYDFASCPDDHFSYKAYPENVKKEKSHTGKRSIKVAPHATLQVRKVLVECPEVVPQ